MHPGDTAPSSPRRSRVEAHPSVADVYLQPVAVVLHLVYPAVPTGGLLGHRRTAGMDEAQRHASTRPLGVTRSTPQHEMARRIGLRQNLGIACATRVAHPNRRRRATSHMSSRSSCRLAGSPGSSTPCTNTCAAWLAGRGGSSSKGHLSPCPKGQVCDLAVPN